MGSVPEENAAEEPPYLSEELHTEVLEGDRAVHLLLLLQEQHEKPPLHVPQQVAGAIGVHAVVTHDSALLPRGRQLLEMKRLPRAEHKPLPFPPTSPACAGATRGASL